ncbi:hypothetical protein L6452_28114 [Arctium lappa]|uniref:Uncharacterized protein n=1 Tax=Arctium lappa TaxID=4217 RepID=A0ACB8ZWZ7_ARCLA|nr:hypothetical protein L6452_28114 [Arctium lappa]
MVLHSFFLCTLLTISLSFHGITALRQLSDSLPKSAGPTKARHVEYQVINVVPTTPGGISFDNKIGIPFTKEIMRTSNNFIWSVVFQQNDPSDQKPVDLIILYIAEFEGPTGIQWGTNINVSSLYVKGLEGDVKWQFTGLMYHEMTHVFQWDGEGTAPLMLIEGIADYALLISSYAPSQFPKKGEGDKWDEGYGITARFLEYCDGITPSFVAKLNKMMRVKYDVKYFEKLTGKPVDQLWKEYKAKYGH